MFRKLATAGTMLGSALILLPAGIWAQGPPPQEPNPQSDRVDKRPLTIQDYDLWRSIQSVGISDDGRWVSFSYNQREKDATLFFRNLDSGQEHRVERGASPQFSDDGRWAAYFISLPQEELENRQEGRGPAPRKAELRDLETGETWSWENVSSFSFSAGARALAVKKAKADRDAEHDGTELIIRYLERGYEELLGSVEQFSFNDSGNLLAYTVDAPDRDGNGIYLLDADTGARRPLDNAGADYARLTWDEDGMGVAVLRGMEVEDFIELENTLLAFTDLTSSVPARFEYSGSDDESFPHGMVVSEKGALSWSADRSRIFFGVRSQLSKPSTLCDDSDEGDGPPEGHAGPALSDPLICSDIPVANVDIWHWQDDRIQTVQENQLNADRNRTFRSAIHIDDGRFVQLADDRMRTVQITDDGRWAIGQDRTAYISDWKPNYSDYYRVDTYTGDRTLMMERHETTLGLSPDGDNYLYWKDGQIWNYRIEDDTHTNLTRSAPVNFTDVEDDHTGEKPPYGVEGWTADEDAVILNHRYDLYLQPLDGTAATNLTGGMGDENKIRFRYVRTDADADFIDLDQPILLSAYGQWTKQAGFYRLDDGELEELRYEDARFGNPIKAADTDRVLLTRQTFETFPDYHATTLDFDEFDRITDANPQQAEFYWGSRILFDYTNDDGVPLQGTLAIPEGYQPGQKLAMLVHFYEKLSQNLHSYPTPRYASSPNYAGYVSNGYLVMEPDVHFRTRTSHSDMVESVEAAVQAVIDLGYVDPERVGLHGHSYSGGGASYISTQSDMFAAIVAGAAPINLRSEFNQIWPGSGSNNHRYDIYGQGRYGTDPYTDLELYLDQSPITHAPTMNTPLLYLHGVEDAIVPWIQGLEFYNALRFLEKPVIWLSYPEEGHGLGEYENRVDFQIRVRQFFDHYLKDEPAPRWMTEGRSYMEKERVLGTNEDNGNGSR